MKCLKRNRMEVFVSQVGIAVGSRFEKKLLTGKENINHFLEGVRDNQGSIFMPWECGAKERLFMPTIFQTNDSKP